MSFYSFVRPLLFALDPEVAHTVALKTLRLLPRSRDQDPALLKSHVFGLDFSNPIGLAAGFDKNAHATRGLAALGFGFLEVGTITPKPQHGNPRPRILRLPHEKALINRMGFPSQGEQNIRKQLQKSSPIPIGINIGPNAHSPHHRTQRIRDYKTLLKRLAPSAAYVTLNISSPNTPDLQELQQGEQLKELLQNLPKPKVPLLLKIAPDIQNPEEIAHLAREHHIDGLIIANTLFSQHPRLSGGLSGQPLFQRSTQLLKTFYRLTDGQLPLIGVGGIFSGRDAYEKIRCGASLLQLYTALVYEGPNVIRRIKHELAELLLKDGFTTVTEAIGADVN